MNINPSESIKCLYIKQVPSKTSSNNGNGLFDWWFWPVVKPPGQVRGWQRPRIVCRRKLSFSFSPPRLCKCLLIKFVGNILGFLPPNSLHCFSLSTAYQSNFLSLSFSSFYCLRPEQSEFLLLRQNCLHTGWGWPSDWLTANTRKWWDSITVWSLEKWPA